MPSYREEASKALNRRDELQRLKDRLSSGIKDLWDEHRDRAGITELYNSIEGT